ncbi:uncharacterized protein LOC130666554 isoform X2 [Microplitis mediator]|uniref:uncharacterized protein LOC130666554 isoform X2 n=1 Tax=Microplitis mediator TaxID=375433 RepID=UPI002555729D|nr:uncharacterized protein LOC130666554 isoform X2 [Microplitis mediator]
MSRVVITLARSKQLTLSRHALHFHLPSLLLVLLFILIATNFVAASEFPERECCDPIYPIPEPTSKAPSVPTPTGRSGPNIKTAVAILNCLFARQLCFEDPSCSAILEIIPRVCGPELVACSTVTVTKCQAALKTLQAFSFFRPTCLCKEPHVDPECNSFQNFLFDHPCIYVLKKDKDPYPIDALLTCNHALSVCQRAKPCFKLYEDFKASCKIRENKCKMESREACHDAWTQLRLSPMFGCICPGNQIKKRCDKIFSAVNHNPCVDFLPSSASLDLSGTDSALYPFDPQQENFQEIWLPPTMKIISHPDNTTSFEIIESQLENPLIDADHQDLHALKQLALPGFRHRPHHRRNHSTDDDDSAIDIEKIHQPVKLILSSTCHQAYSMCRNDSECRGLFQPILNHCDASSCARNECMNALQNFYKKANDSHSMEIAFCLCKKTQDKDDECIVAQEKMHPVCAQGHDLSELPTCHSLALACREDNLCRNKLEHYEQSCAVDSVTKKCAGPPADCRRAMLGILGTELRSNCACKGTDLTQLYDCLGWQRLLWVNPCVVESQKDFHARKKHRHHSNMRPTTTLMSTDTWGTSATFLAITPLITDSVEDDNVIPEVTKKSTTQPTMNDVDTFSVSSSIILSTPSTTSTTIVITTPSTTTTSTPPPRFCVFQRPRQNHQYIREGKGKRLYRDNEPECSDLCQCGEGVTLVCNTICVQPSPCKTPFAFYNHAAPAYQAFRGRCLCYSGRFICMRPSPETYNIPHGVFMFLGYSETDEDFMKTYNNLTVLDAVNSLDSFMREEANNKTMCTLFLYNVTQENVIAVARLGGNNPPPNSSQAQSLQHLLRIKEECGAMLQDLSDKINNKHQEVHTHPLLSIFKMAEVEVKLPEGNGATTIVIKMSPFKLIFILLTTTLIQCILLTTFNHNHLNNGFTS